MNISPTVYIQEQHSICGEVIQTTSSLYSSTHQIVSVMFPLPCVLNGATARHLQWYWVTCTSVFVPGQERGGDTAVYSTRKSLCVSLSHL